MSKAFTSEETVDAPEVVAPRSPIPAGVTNYVTPHGLELLKSERARLVEARAEPRRIAELDDRLASARPVDPKTQPQDQVRFGAVVVVKGSSGAERQYQLVGIDEADVANGKIAFVAPLARALLGKQVGEAASVRTPHGDDELEVISIRY